MPNNSMDNNDKFSTSLVLRSGTKSLDLTSPIVMGILNLTPDSFYAGSRLQSSKDFIERAEKHIIEGAAIIDIGAVSTRPGASKISDVEESDRLLSALKELRSRFPDVWISIDTWRAGIAKQCLAEGADMINDISGGTFDAEMPKIMAENNNPYILMHIKGEPQNMQQNPVYENVLKEISTFFKTQSEKFLDAGATQLILDPGFGFGKTLEHNYHLLKHLEEFHHLGHPLMVGVSRKSMIHKLLDSTAENALNGTTVLNTLAIQKGAKLLRVHDVKEAVETIKIIQALHTS